MAGRRKPDPAQLRTIGLFSGRTPLEEAASVLEEDASDLESDRLSDARRKNPLAMVEHGEEAAVRWLGLDVFHEGDDIKVAIHPKGHAVLMLVRTVETGRPYSTATIKLSKAQWSKLKTLARNER